MKSTGVLPHQPSTKYHNIILFSVQTGMWYELICVEVRYIYIIYVFQIYKGEITRDSEF